MLHLRGSFFNPQKFGVWNHCSRCWIWVGSWTYPLQFLPLAHIYERVFLQYGLISGMKIGYPQGPLPTTLFEDIKVLEPTFLCLVPRVYTKLEAAIKAQTVDSDKPLMKYLFTKAINNKLELQQQEDHVNPSNLAYDWLLNLLRKKIGMKNVELLVTGSAPLAEETYFF